MREKLETLSLAQLREIAKENGLKKISTLKKDELIERLLEFSGANEEKEDKKEHSQKEDKGVR